MKKVPCSFYGCSGRRVHNEQPYVQRDHVMVEVPDDFRGKAFCSFECQAYSEGTKNIIPNNNIVFSFES